MMMRPDHCAVDHLQLVRRNSSMVESVQDVLPQPCQRPAAELAVDRRPLAELFGQVTPSCTSSRNPEYAIQNKTMIRRSTPVRATNWTNKAFEEGPVIVGYKVASQDHLPRRDELESQNAGQRNPFCQHDIGRPEVEEALDGQLS
jgi:hypothetical protein